MKKNLQLFWFLFLPIFIFSQAPNNICWKTIHQSFAIKADGTVWDVKDYKNPRKIAPANNWVKVILFDDNSDMWQWEFNKDKVLGLDNNGTLWKWQVNNYNPIIVGGVGEWKDFDIYEKYNSQFIVGLKKDGSLWNWGKFWNDSEDSYLVFGKNPVKVDTESNCIDILADLKLASVIKNDGSLWRWGYNGYRYIADIPENIVLKPVRIGDKNDYYRIGKLIVNKSESNWSEWIDFKEANSVGLAIVETIETIGLKNDGTLWYKLENGDYIKYGNESNWSLLSGSYAIKNDGTLWVLGYEIDRTTTTLPKQILCAQDDIPDCVIWVLPPLGDPLMATNFLCFNNIIDHNQNGSSNASQPILRQDLAKILYNALYMGKISESPADNFPVPFNDMQTLSGNEYWYRAAKNLAYLQYQDDKTAFDRDFVNFNPQKPIERRYAVKALLEAFNIPKSTDTSNPFTDVSITDEMFGFIKKVHELGIMTVAEFRPTDFITREEAFILLWKVLKSSDIVKPTRLQLADPSNYFTPGNYRTATLGKVPDVSQGNFNHYQKTSFSIPGRGVSLDFTHTYNSFLTELPKDFLKITEDAGNIIQYFTPVGIGWTHTYNVYAIKYEGYSANTDGTTITEPAKIYFYYPDGSINVYFYDTLQPDTNTVGVYDTLQRTSTADGERITVTTKGQIKYVFENRENGKGYFIQSIRDRNNNGVKINWVKNTIYGYSYHRIDTVQEIFTDDSVGRSLTFAYHPDYPGAVTSVTDNSIGRTIEFTYEKYGNLLSYKDPKGQITTYKYESSDNYNTSNLLSEIILPKGNKVKNTYFQRKLRTSETFGANGVSTSSTNVDWKPSYGSSQYNSTSKITDAQGKNTAYEHNSLGNPTKIAKLDASGNELSEGKTEFLSYDSGNNANLPTQISVSGQSSSINYDAKGNVLNVTKNGITNSFTYTAFNDVDKHTDANGNITDYDYDSKGNLVAVKRPAIGGSTIIERNNFGQVTKVINPAGITTQFAYNSNGLTNKISLPLGIETSSEYDNASRLIKTVDALGKINLFEYDNNDNLTKSTDANGGVVSHDYDANDNHLSITNQKNETQTNTYNFDDDMLESETFGSHTKSYTYNTDGSLATHTRGNGTFTYTYDEVTGRLKSDGYTNYTYDIKGNIKTITNGNGTITLNYDINDRLEYYTDYYGNTVKYTYDNNNNATAITYPDNKMVSYEYDALNRCTSVTDWNGKTTSYEYLIDDRIDKITLPNGTFTKYTYDAVGRPTGIVNKKLDGTVISEYSFTLDKAGNHTQEIIIEPSIIGGLQNLLPHTDTYGEYPYNRIQSQNSDAFVHNTAGGITQSGNDTFTYDIYDNVLSANGSISANYNYDGAGNRREKTVAGVTTRYVLSILGMSQVLAETDYNNSIKNYYIYGPTGLLYRVKADQAYSYYHYDYRGSTTAISDNSQDITHSYSYDPFGKVLAKTEADANPYQYVGKYGVQYESPTLTFMRARYYNPKIGRFISEDPIWALNLYPYAGNNPIENVDTNGKTSESVRDFYNADTPEKFSRMMSEYFQSTLGTDFSTKDIIMITSDRGVNESIEGLLYVREIGLKQNKNWLSATPYIKAFKGVTDGLLVVFDAVTISFHPSYAPRSGELDIVNVLSIKYREEIKTMEKILKSQIDFRSKLKMYRQTQDKLRKIDKLLMDYGSIGIDKSIKDKYGL